MGSQLGESIRRNGGEVVGMRGLCYTKEPITEIYPVYPELAPTNHTCQDLGTGNE